MNQKEYEKKEYELKSYIADKFVDIQQNSLFLKTVEDVDKVKNTMHKIKDFIDDINRGYNQLEELSREEIVEETEEEVFENKLNNFNVFTFYKSC